MAAEQLDLPGNDFDGIRPRRRPSRGMYVLPSLFTAGNIGAGYYAITQSIQGSAVDHSGFDHAALAIGLAALLDGVDGYIARLTHTTSDFGKELDSLADVITFGVAPSLLAYLWGFKTLPLTVYPQLRDNVLHAGIFVCFLFFVFDLRGEPAGAVQHQRGPTAAQSREAWKEVLCGYADSGRCRRDCGCSALLRWLPSV